MEKKENGKSSGTRVVKDLAPRSEIKGGDTQLQTMITQLLEMQHEGKKAVIQNLRA